MLERWDLQRPGITLKIRRPSGLGGSTPPPGTMDSKEVIFVLPKRRNAPLLVHVCAKLLGQEVAARDHSEPAGQVAAREMEIVRIKGALQRAEELSDDVAAAIEWAL